MDPVRELVEKRPFGAEVLRAADAPEAIPVAGGIYMSPGTSNAYMVLTDGGRVIINTGLGFEALTHKRNFDAVSQAPTTHILVTQGHVDHVGGVGLFREPGTRFIAQANNLRCQADDERIAARRQTHSYVWFAEVIDGALEIAKQHPDVVVQDAPVPDELFTDTLVLETGKVRFELLSCPGGETIDNTVIWLPYTRTAFVGNTFGPLFPHFPNFNTVRGDRYRDPLAYLDTLARVRDLGAEVLITGHGLPIEGAGLIRACLDRLEAAVRYVHDETVRGINEGRDIDDVARTLRLPDELYVGEGYGRVSWGVRTIWESYLGWFKLRSTRELYPAAPVTGTLAAMLGAEAVVDAGRALLNAPAADTGATDADSTRTDNARTDAARTDAARTDNALRALGLAEAALEAEPGHRAALRLARDAHERLLEHHDDARNFWLGGWLRAQHGKLVAQLAAPPPTKAEVGEVARLMTGMPKRFVPGAAPGLHAVYQYELDGAAGEPKSTWAVIVEGDRCRVSEGAHPHPSCRIGMSAEDFVALNYGELHPLKAAMQGKLRFEGDRKVAIHLDKLFTKIKRPAAQATTGDTQADVIRIDDLRDPVLTPTQRTLKSLAERAQVRFERDAVLDAARRRTGLRDFGPEDFHERLDLLLADYRADTTLSGLGKQTVYGDLVRYASNRLLLQDLYTRHPEIDDEVIAAPVIVAGLPRSGTTHLVNLLAADSRFRSLPLWELLEPVPNPREGEPGKGRRALFAGLDRALPEKARSYLGVDTLAADPRHLRCTGKWAGMRLAVPHLAAMHPMTPDHIHEEIELMGPDFASYVFEWTGHVPRYRDHSYATDQTPHFAYMLRALRALQWQDRVREGRAPGAPAKRFVLKCPQHLENLPALNATFPDATVVFTHRDPVAVIQSTVTMLGYAERVGRTRVDADQLIAYWSERIERLLRKGVQDRALIPTARSYDSLFHEFMRDTEGTLDNVYARAGIPQTATSRAEQRAFLEAHPRGKDGRLEYDLERGFGVKPEALRERFAFYFERFPVRVEG
ncbi:MAG: sulfotransferase [Myxococcales bacterium]|nr:sulfotransferase [Myxococcales bacterium]